MGLKVDHAGYILMECVDCSILYFLIWHNLSGTETKINLSREKDLVINRVGSKIFLCPDVTFVYWINSFPVSNRQILNYFQCLGVLPS